MLTNPELNPNNEKENPYSFLHDEAVVHVEYTENGKSLEECLINLFSGLKNR